MSTETLLGLGCENVCECGRYPNPHSHSFILGKSIKKNCPDCGEIEPEAQIYGILFGGNKVHLRNAYECKCKRIKETEILYDGVPKPYQEIYVIVNSKFGA